MNIEKEQRAIKYLQSFEPEDEPYYLCYSGGKDSDCIRILAELAGVKHECKHNLTTVDAPETVYYVRETIGKENSSDTFGKILLFGIKREGWQRENKNYGR